MTSDRPTRLAVGGSFAGRAGTGASGCYAGRVCER